MTDGGYCLRNNVLSALADYMAEQSGKTSAMAVVVSRSTQQSPLSDLGGYSRFLPTH